MKKKRKFRDYHQENRKKKIKDTLFFISNLKLFTYIRLNKRRQYNKFIFINWKKKLLDENLPKFNGMPDNEKVSDQRKALLSNKKIFSKRNTCRKIQRYIGSDVYAKGTDIESDSAISNSLINSNFWTFYEFGG